MKSCASTDVGTWTNWLTFEPDPDYSPDAGTGLLSPISYKRCYAEFYVGKIPLAARRYSKPWFYNGFIHWAVGRPLSEVNALCRVPFHFCTIIYTDFCVCTGPPCSRRVRSSVRPSVCYNKLVIREHDILKRMNRVWCQLANVTIALLSWLGL